MERTLKKNFKRFFLWITKPLRIYIQYRFKISIQKDIAIYEAHLKAQKPKWTPKMIRKRARAKYWLELKKVGLVNSPN